MIEINLLPDVKQEFLRAQKMRNTVVSIAIMTGIAAVGLVVVLGFVLGGQKVADALVENTIKDQYNKLSSEKDLSNIVTIQNQLAKITELNDSKNISSRVFDMLSVINPPSPDNVMMSNIIVDPVEKIVSIEGSAENGYPAAEAFKKTLLNTKLVYRTESDPDTKELPLTDKVDIGETSYGEDASGAKVLRFTISFAYAEDLLSNTIAEMNISSPTSKVDVTDSKLRVPDSIFSQRPSDIKEDQ